MTPPPASAGELPETDSAAAADDIKNQLDLLRQDVAGLAKAIREFGTLKAEELSERASRLGEDASDGLASVESDLEERIREKPLKAVVFAAGVGYLFAAFTRR